MSDDQKKDAIFRVDTVPPPAGSDNAYDAPTKVGPMAAAAAMELIAAAERKVTEFNERAAQGQSDAAPRSRPARPIIPREEPVEPPQVDKPLPRLFEDVDDKDNTGDKGAVLSPRAAPANVESLRATETASPAERFAEPAAEPIAAPVREPAAEAAAAAAPATPRPPSEHPPAPIAKKSSNDTRRTTNVLLVVVIAIGLALLYFAFLRNGAH